MKPDEHHAAPSPPTPRESKPHAPHSGEGAASAMNEMVRKRIEPGEQKQAPQPGR